MCRLLVDGPNGPSCESRLRGDRSGGGANGQFNPFTSPPSSGAKSRRVCISAGGSESAFEEGPLLLSCLEGLPFGAFFFAFPGPLRLGGRTTQSWRPEQLLQGFMELHLSFLPETNSV